MSVCIPSTVDVIGRSFWRDCQFISNVSFESGSRLSRIEEFVFGYCHYLKSICLPSLVGLLCQRCFTGSFDFGI
jgi:hypothetical protein